MFVFFEIYFYLQKSNKLICEIVFNSFDWLFMSQIKQDRFTTCFKDLWNEFLGFLQKV